MCVERSGADNPLGTVGNAWRRGRHPSEGLLDSALARPQNLIAYGESDPAALAASYGFGIARDRPFIDGNKRTALVVCEFFLAKNALAIDATNAEMVAVFLDLASGEISEAELAAWLRERVTAS